MILMSKKEIAWDLTEIFLDYDDPKITERMNALEKQAEKFVSLYKGKITGPDFTSGDLLNLLKQQEEFYADLEELGAFSINSYNANMTLPESKSFYSKFKEFITKILKKIAFLELELGKFVHKNKDLINDPELENYKHILEKIIREVPHYLSEVEEQLILEKDQFGIKGWEDLQSTWLNTREFKVIVEGEEKLLSYGEADALLSHPDRDTRISANKSIYGLLGGDEEIFSSALRNICGDWMKITKRRRYESPMHQSLIFNDTTQIIIDNLMKTIEESVEVYRKYLRIKAKILNLPILSCADVRAPLPMAPDKKYSWDEARDLMIQVYGKFDKTFEEIVNDMFKNKHIDATVRKGKRNGAYCDYWYKGNSSFVLLSFTGTMKEIYTLGHELGHSIHGTLSSKEQTYFNYQTGSTVAETASIFGELLLTDLLLERAESNEEKLSILAHVLDEAGMVAFQVSARVFFEHGLYEAIEKGENLDGKTISKCWCAGRDKIYGDAVEWFEEMDWEWTMKPHYYITSTRFYNYPYVYAQLFVYALYRIYKKEGKNFVPKFKKLLSAGGSRSPDELGEMVGFDITKPDFWKLGIKQFEEFVNQVEKLIK